MKWLHAVCVTVIFCGEDVADWREEALICKLDLWAREELVLKPLPADKLCDSEVTVANTAIWTIIQLTAQNMHTG